MNDFKITGIVAEYNPFHSGHSYQISKVKSDATVAVMSGSFVQRGDVAAADKWTRAKYAVLGGVDLVVELPVVFALNTAQKFALGAVSLLDSMGIDELCFGSESGDINALFKTAELIENEPEEISEKIKELTAAGMSYPSAREKAYTGSVPDGVLSEPNNILAVEYLRALIRLNSKITPVTVKRHGAGYKDTMPQNDIASASAIRTMLKNNEDVSAFTDFNDVPNDLSKLDSAVTANLRLMSAKTLSQINEVGEGLENRILRAAAVCSSIEEIAENVKTKRYTMSRIKRILISSLLGLTADMSLQMPSYIRPLAMNKKGMAALKEIKSRSSLPIISKTADYKEKNPMFEADIRATDIAALCESGDKKAAKDFTQSPLIL